LAIAHAAARRRREVQVDVFDARPGQVVHSDGVRAAKGVELNVLDPIEVHGDVGDVAGESRPTAVGRDVDLLVDVRAVEQQRVGSGLALDDVAAVARVPDIGVVARAKQAGVIATPTVDQVIACAADDQIIAVAAIDRELDLIGIELGGVDDVVAAEPVDGERVEAGVHAAHDRLRRQSVDDHRRAAAYDTD
jgi:hypothetical protein